MHKTFWDDPYQKTLKTHVLSVLGNKVLLKETIAFSFSGGQESDNATLNGLPITGSEIDGFLIYYTFQEGHNFSPGDEVLLELNWPRRYRLMRLHFAAELVLELVTRKLNLEKIGAHIAEDKARIDFIFDQNIFLFFEEILSEYNAIIEKDMPIKTGFSDIKNQRRFWEIEGFSKVPCGGTHVKSTGEVGFITLRRKNIGQSKERIEIKLIDENTHTKHKDSPKQA
ncbi:MAG: alanyl-tRNA editing protein [Proteobacteria bacterium]|nr:alanyl-tRNA editing protein [Pseudomonadota bacterium]